MNFRAISIAALLGAFPAVAESGPPYMFCRDATCPCGANTCVCGDACNGYTFACEPRQVSYCTNDAMCAGPCGSFMCEGNVCVPGERDGGEPVHDDDGGPGDAGHHQFDGGDIAVPGDGGWGDAGIITADAGAVNPPSTRAGCSEVPALALILAGLLVRVRRSRRE